MKKFILLNLILLTILLPVPSRGHNGQERMINILYTGSLNGQLEPCGCSPKTDFGGVARQSGYIAENRKALSPYILIDAGNFAGDDTTQGRLKADTLLQAFSAMNYDLIAFQKNERKFTDDYLSSLIKKYKIPFVSNTHHYKLSISKTKNALNMHISADPGDYEKHQLNILLTDLSLFESKTIKGWDVIINSSGELLEEPLRIDGTLIVTGYPKGEKLGILTLYIDSAGKITNYKHRWQPLGNVIKEDKKVRQFLNDYDSRVARLLKENEKPQTETAYLGVAKCAECHQPYIEIWKKTGHAKAFSSLEKAGKSSDPECLKCHTVGFWEDGGFYSISTTPELANVQCEVCHGTGRDHLMDFYKPMEHVTEAVCLKCHTKDKSPDFTYKDYLDKIIH